MVAAEMGATLLLVCAVMVSLAGGVLLAYGICLGMFRVFRVHSQVAARQRQERLVVGVVAKS